jgi:hypothetical protein
MSNTRQSLSAKLSTLAQLSERATYKDAQYGQDNQSTCFHEPIANDMQIGVQSLIKINLFHDGAM